MKISNAMVIDQLRLAVSKIKSVDFIVESIKLNLESEGGLFGYDNKSAENTVSYLLDEFHGGRDDKLEDIINILEGLD